MEHFFGYFSFDEPLSEFESIFKGKFYLKLLLEFFKCKHTPFKMSERIREHHCLHEK